MGTTSKKRKCNLDCVLIRYSTPTYNHVIALVGRTAHDSAATNKPSFLDATESCSEEPLEASQ